MNTQIARIEQKNKVLSIDEPDLDEVAESDRPLVSNVIYAMLACKHPESLFTSWSVNCTNTHYIVSAMLPSSDFDISLVDLELINSLSPLRISGISIVSVNNKCKLVVQVLNGNQRVQLNEGKKVQCYLLFCLLSVWVAPVAGELIITQKRRRTWMSAFTG